MADFAVNADSSEQREINLRAHEPDIDELRKRIDSIFPYFCANPGCVQALCPHHGEDFEQARAGLTDDAFQPTTQIGPSLPSRRLYPESQVMDIRKGHPVGAYASGKLIPHFE